MPPCVVLFREFAETYYDFGIHGIRSLAVVIAVLS